MEALNLSSCSCCQEGITAGTTRGGAVLDTIVAALANEGHIHEFFYCRNRWILVATEHQCSGTNQMPCRHITHSRHALPLIGDMTIEACHFNMKQHSHRLFLMHIYDRGTTARFLTSQVPEQLIKTFLEDNELSPMHILSGIVRCMQVIRVDTGVLAITRGFVIWIVTSIAVTQGFWLITGFLCNFGQGLQWSWGLLWLRRLKN